MELNDIKAYEMLKSHVHDIEKTTSIRVTNVLNKKATFDDCLLFIVMLHKAGIKEITFRQMFGDKEAYDNFERLKDCINIDGVMFLKDGEYHDYYFTTDNEVYPYFFGYTKQDREEWRQRYENHN